MTQAARTYDNAPMEDGYAKHYEQAAIGTTAAKHQ